MATEEKEPLLAERALTRSIEKSIQKNWEIDSLGNYKGKMYTHKEVAERILLIHEIFEHFGVKKGDKIALVGKNSAEWGIVYVATIGFGAVIVPILSDFKPDDTVHLINHSDSVLLFMDDSMFVNLSERKLLHVRGSISVDHLEVISKKNDEAIQTLSNAKQSFTTKYKGVIRPADFRLVHSDPEDLAVISYTSGTTGFSKGVMLPHRSLSSNILFASEKIPMDPDSSIVSFLPLAHAYGCAFDFLYPFSLGCNITFLGKSPSPQVVLKAFSEIQPKMIFSVPLVIEKIYKNKIKPAIQKKSYKMASKIPGVKNLVSLSIRKKLLDAFGGKVNELVIGGAAFNPEAESFFRSIGFPFTVGYGMTECGPLITYASSESTVKGSCGRVIDRMEVKILSDDPANTVGEIVTKGSNVLLGYYKNDEATKEILDEEGWLKTGDLGTIDENGNLFIKGRSKTMLLGPSGKNIYPEEVEAILNNLPGVMESVVVMRDQKLVALIYPDYAYFDNDDSEYAGKEPEQLYRLQLKELNKKLPKYLNISDVKVYPTEFEKTPKKSIKRFLYSV